MDKYTPGPWTVQDLGPSTGGCRNIYGADGWEVCCTAGRMGSGDEWDEEDSANAELIASAPTLIAENAQLRAELAAQREATRDANATLAAQVRATKELIADMKALDEATEAYIQALLKFGPCFKCAELSALYKAARRKAGVTEVVG